MFELSLFGSVESVEGKGRGGIDLKKKKTTCIDEFRGKRNRKCCLRVLTKFLPIQEPLTKTF